MNDNEVKNAFDHIEPEPGAQERMYANILKKAAAQREDQNVEEKQPTVKKRRTIPMWRRWGSLVACLAIVIVAGFAFPHFFDRSEPDNPPVFVGSPFEDVDGPEGFEKLGFTIDAPENAENLYYCIYDGKIARVDFTLNGHAYTYEAAKLDGNFSRAEGVLRSMQSMAQRSTVYRLTHGGRIGAKKVSIIIFLILTVRVKKQLPLRRSC